MNKYQFKPKQQYDISALLADEDNNIEDEIHSIELQVAEREHIKQKNIYFLEHQRQSIEEQINRTRCFEYNPPKNISVIRNGLTTQLVQIELKKGEEYTNCFRDIQRLEEQKRNLLAEKDDGKEWFQ